MLSISKLIDNTKEIKSQIGSKTFDIKVIGYYNLLLEGLNLYPKSEQINNMISQEIDYWESLIERDKLNDVDKKRFKKIGLTINIDTAELQNQIGDILNTSKISIEKEHDLIKIEIISFARGLFFYLSNLWFIKNHKNTNGWKVEDLKNDVKTVPENLNFIISYIKEIGRLNYDEMCIRYSKIVNNVKKTEYIKFEIEEHSNILKSHIPSNDWKYIDDHFEWSIIGLRPNGFNIDDIRNIHSLLINGDFYSAILKYEIGVELTTLLLTTEMYIEFLQNQISTNKSIEEKTTIDVVKSNVRNSDLSFKINPERHESLEKVQKGLIPSEIDADLKDMMNSLILKKYIDSETKISNFKKIFSGTEVKDKVNWIAGNNLLNYFISELYKNKLEKVKNDEKWIVGFKCFKVAGINDEKIFSKKIRDANTLTNFDSNQLNNCINHLRIKKNNT